MQLTAHAEKKTSKEQPKFGNNDNLLTKRIKRNTHCVHGLLTYCRKLLTRFRLIKTTFSKDLSFLLLLDRGSQND